jgi:hypothetical protein
MSRAPDPSGLPTKERIRARDLAVGAALLGLHHAPAIHYSQGAMRFDGIIHQAKAWRGQFPTALDCSAFVTWCLWNGLDHFHLRDIVNGAGWRAGYTGTLAEHGARVDGLALQRADVALYGRRWPFEHTALVIGRDRTHRRTLVISHGSEGGPYLLPIDYRADLAQVRRYI